MNVIYFSLFIFLCWLNFKHFISVVKCNCSICHMKQNHHFIVPKEDFTLISGESNLTVYTFNTGAAK